MPAALDDAALGSVIRSFGSSAKLGIKALTAEDAAYGEPDQLAAFLHSHERVLRLAIRSIFLDATASDVLRQYGRLIDSPELPIGRQQGVLGSRAPGQAEEARFFCV